MDNWICDNFIHITISFIISEVTVNQYYTNPPNIPKTKTKSKNMLSGIDTYQNGGKIVQFESTPGSS